MKKIFIGFVIVVALLVVGFFIFGYHFPIKLEDNKEELIEMINNTTKDSVIEKSLNLDNTVGVYETESGDLKDMQVLKYKTYKDSIEVDHDAFVLLNNKVLGYTIDTVKVFN